jgi:DtxR family Mn-dependent transcriptional regulator
VQARLAERVGHSSPTVSAMVQRLKEAGHVTSEGQGLRLTGTGRELAESVLRKHCLAAHLLADIVGLPWHLVHAEADRWEHIISDDVEARLVEVLGNPNTCPHGCPVPGSCPQLGPPTTLADAQVGQRARLVRLVDPASFDLDGLAYLEENHFVPGCEATIVAKGPDGTLVLSAGGHRLVMGAPMTAQLRVALSS